MIFSYENMSKVVVKKLNLSNIDYSSMRKDVNSQLLRSLYCLVFGATILTLPLMYQTAEAGSKDLPGQNPSAQLITGYWTANIERVNGKYAEQTMDKTDTLYWTTSFDPRSKKANYYRIHDFSVDSTETLEGYPKVLFISDARIEFGKHLQEFVRHGKKNKQEILFYAHIGAWQELLVDKTSFTYSDGTIEMNANHTWEGLLNGVWYERKGTGTIAIWDGQEYQEIFLTNVTFSLENAYAAPKTIRKFESKTKPFSSEQIEIIEKFLENTVTQ